MRAFRVKRFTMTHLTASIGPRQNNGVQRATETLDCDQAMERTRFKEIANGGRFSGAEREQFYIDIASPTKNQRFALAAIAKAPTTVILS